MLLATTKSFTILYYILYYTICVLGTDKYGWLFYLKFLGILICVVMTFFTLDSMEVIYIFYTYFRLNNVFLLSFTVEQQLC